jgi:hypothetical protein
VARSGKALFTSLNVLLFKNYFLATVEDEQELVEETSAPMSDAGLEAVLEEL